MQDHTEDNEYNIINRIKNGETNAFEFLVKIYGKPLYIMINNIIKEPFIAEDLLQEVFLAAYLNIQSFNPELGKFSTWLFRIARNKCFNDLKKNKFKANSDVPDITGKEELSKGQNVGAVATSIALDILLDPLTYLTFGAGSAIKIGNKGLTKAGTKMYAKLIGEGVAKGMTREVASELAEKAGLAKATIRAVYYDTWKQLGRDTIKKICAALDIDISDIFEITRDDKAA